MSTNFKIHLFILLARKRKHEITFIVMNSGIIDQVGTLTNLETKNSLFTYKLFIRNKYVSFISRICNN